MDGEEYVAELDEMIWDGHKPEIGQAFTLHFRGQRFLYTYVIDRPRVTRAQVKRARIWARKTARLFDSPRVSEETQT